MSTPAFVQKFLAKTVANMMYAPSGFARPSDKTVIKRLQATMDVGMDEYNAWPKEKFLLPNGSIEIPAEYHPLPDHRGVAILAHGFGQSRYVMVPYARMLRKMGYSTIMFDQRHFGQSKAANGGFGLLEATDLVALIRWVKQRCGEDTRILVLGVSMGAMTVMHAMGLTDSIDAAVADCGPSVMEEIIDPFYKSLSKEPNQYLHGIIRTTSEKCGAPSWENRPIDKVAGSDVPLLVNHTSGDNLVPVQHAKDIAAASKSPLTRLEIFSDREHALSIVDYELYRDALSRFLWDVFGE